MNQEKKSPNFGLCACMRESKMFYNLQQKLAQNVAKL